MAQTQFEIIKHLHSFPVVEGMKYQKEINLVSWYGKEPKYDIRGWSEEQGCRKPGRGISLSEVPGADQHRRRSFVLRGDGTCT